MGLLLEYLQVQEKRASVLCLTPFFLASDFLQKKYVVFDSSPCDLLILLNPTFIKGLIVNVIVGVKT